MTQTLSGSLTADSWDNATATAFAQTVVASINAVASTRLAADKIEINSVKAASRRGRFLEDAAAETLWLQQCIDSSLLQKCAARAASAYGRSLASDLTRLLSLGVAVDYTVSMTVQEAVSTDPASAFSTVSAALTTAVTGTTFNSQLSAAAGSTALSSATASTTAPLVSQPTFVVTRSAVPSGSPTSAPSLQHCPAGYRHQPIGTGTGCIICEAGRYAPYDSMECSICPPGHYSGKGYGHCPQCEIGFYSDGWGRGPECKKCPWPSTSAFPGSTNCLAFSIHLDDVQVSGINIFGAILFIGCCIMAKRPDRFELNDVLPAAAFTFMPALDFVSDVLYVLQTTVREHLFNIPSWDSGYTRSYCTQKQYTNY